MTKMIVKSRSNLAISWTCEKKNGIHPQLNLNHKENKSNDHIKSNGRNMQVWVNKSELSKRFCMQNCLEIS